MSVVLGSSREVSVVPTVGLQGDHGGFGVGGGGGGSAAEMTRVSTTATSGGLEKERVVVAPPCFLEVVHKEKCTPGLVMKLGSASNSSKVVNACSTTYNREEEEDDDDDDDDDEDGEVDDDDDVEVQIKFKGALSSMGSLEESLPIKRGLSNFFSGKSKSFANLSDVTAVKDLAKPENPFNKRRRTLIARSWRPGRPFHHTHSLTSFASVPAFASSEDDKEEEEICGVGARKMLHQRF